MSSSHSRQESGNLKIAAGGLLAALGSLLLLSSISAFRLYTEMVSSLVVRVEEPDALTGALGSILLALGLIVLARGVDGSYLGLTLSVSALVGSLVFGLGLVTVAQGVPAGRLAIVVGGLIVAFSWALAGISIISVSRGKVWVRLIAGVWFASLVVLLIAPVAGILVAVYFTARAIRGGQQGARTRRGVYPLPGYFPCYP